MITNFAFTSTNSDLALVYDKAGGTLLHTVGCGGQRTVTIQADLAQAYVILKDDAGREQLRSVLYPGLNYFVPSTALFSGISNDLSYPASVRSAGGVTSLTGRIQHTSGTASSLLHIASGFRPSADVRGVAFLDGTSIEPITIGSLGTVSMTPSASWTALGLQASWVN